MSKVQPVVLSIAGSDNSGGAGIQADIKTCCALGVYAATTITAVVSENTRHVYDMQIMSEEMIASQIDSILEFIRPDAIKIGMLPTPGIIKLVSEKLNEYNLKNIVVDPVMVATNGDALVDGSDKTVQALKEFLFPLATIITPNIPEAARLLSMREEDIDMLSDVKRLVDELGANAALLNGGHSDETMATDYLRYDSKTEVYKFERINSINTHGTGCTLSSAIACGLAKGHSLDVAVIKAKEFVYNAIKQAEGLNIAKGPGPLNFLCRY